MSAIEAQRAGISRVWRISDSERRLLAQSGPSEMMDWECPLLEAKRKTFARIELFRFGPKGDISLRPETTIQTNSAFLKEGLAR